MGTRNTDEFDTDANALAASIEERLRRREEANELLGQAGALMHEWSDYASKHRYDAFGRSDLLNDADTRLKHLARVNESLLLGHWPTLPDGQPSTLKLDDYQ